MEKLLSPFIFLTPIFLLLILYRFWQLVTKRHKFKNKAVATSYAVLITTTTAGYGYIGYYFFRCIWPNNCGEGFASGYITASVLLGAGIVSVGFIFTEILLAASLRKVKHENTT